MCFNFIPLVPCRINIRPTIAHVYKTFAFIVTLTFCCVRFASSWKDKKCERAYSWVYTGSLGHEVFWNDNSHWDFMSCRIVTFSNPGRVWWWITRMIVFRIFPAISSQPKLLTGRTIVGLINSVHNLFFLWLTKYKDSQKRCYFHSLFQNEWPDPLK